MQAHPGHVLVELKKLVLEEIKDQSYILETGAEFNVPDYASYKHIIGKISALRKVVEFFDEAESIVEKRT